MSIDAQVSDALARARGRLNHDGGILPFLDIYKLPLSGMVSSRTISVKVSCRLASSSEILRFSLPRSDVLTGSYTPPEQSYPPIRQLPTSIACDGSSRTTLSRIHGECDHLANFIGTAGWSPTWFFKPMRVKHASLWHDTHNTQA